MVGAGPEIVGPGAAEIASPVPSRNARGSGPIGPRVHEARACPAARSSRRASGPRKPRIDRHPFELQPAPLSAFTGSVTERCARAGRRSSPGPAAGEIERMAIEVALVLEYKLELRVSPANTGATRPALRKGGARLPEGVRIERCPGPRAG